MVARIGIRRPTLSVEFQSNTFPPTFTIRLFGICLLRKDMAAKWKPGGAKKGLLLARSAAISRLAVSASYGLGDPFLTAMALPAASAVAKVLPFEKLDAEPDYLSADPYLSIRGNATIKMGKTIRRYLKNK